MRTSPSTRHEPAPPAGFTLPAVLTVMCAVFIAAVAALLVAGVERGSARCRVERQRAELAAQAALEELRAILNAETANDDFLVIQSEGHSAPASARSASPQLFLARGRAADAGYTYRYVPLFSCASRPPDSPQLAAPDCQPLLGAHPPRDPFEFSALPYQEMARAAWLPVYDEHGHSVARYAYWVEDLQGKLDPGLTGNLSGPDHTHDRAAYPFPAPGLNPAPADGDAAAAPPLDQIALFAIDPAATSANQGTLARTLIENRRLLLSPASTLAAAGLTPPLARDPATGAFTDASARAVEENLAANIEAYFERPLIPFAPGIHPAAAGTPRLNLNALLARPPADAVAEMAAAIRAALPEFSQRKGGFPENYIETLAANAVDYADADSNPTLKAGAYRGLDAYPLLSEIALQVNYAGISPQDGRHIMTFRFQLFAELINPTNQPVAGGARLSYEVALPMDSIGSGVGGEPFDSPSLLDNPAVASHDLSRLDDKYWTREIPVSLQPNQYCCYRFADVTYRMDVGAASHLIPDATPFSLNESQGASGVSLKWNGEVVERAQSILRQAGLIYAVNHGVVSGGFHVGTPKTLTKAALPGHVYDDYPDMYYNMGDPRVTHYLRGAQLDENAYPENASPNRRNVRLQIYSNDIATKPKVYARMLPSEWPDGGHNAAVGSWSPGTSDKTEMTDHRFDFPYDPQMALAAPQIISNRGRFFSVTELGRVFDPALHAPAFPSPAVTQAFRGNGKMPEAGACWPDFARNQSGPFYGGGNTLRIGRPEHPAFDYNDAPGMHAALLLDIFHTGLSRSARPADREGPLTRIEGHVNVNTAPLDTLRALAAGLLVMDPLLARRIHDNHLGVPIMAPPVAPLPLAAPTSVSEADRIAHAIIHCRPFASAAALARANEPGGQPVFGNKDIYPAGSSIEWTDAAAEETFARVFESATLRSRNFRVWIVAQSLAPATTPDAPAVVLAEVRKAYTLFADPGDRAADGSIIPANFHTTITSANDF